MPITIDNTNSFLSTTGVARTETVGDTVTIAANGYLISTVDDALLLSGTSQDYTVIVQGLLASTSASFAGLTVLGPTNDANIIVAESGTIRGAIGQGIFLAGGGVATITNDGAILCSGSLDGAISVGDDFGGTTVQNNGFIWNSNNMAIRISGSGAFTLTNTGIIEGGSLGVAIDSVDSSIDTITNSGIIRGNVSLGGGDDFVDNTLGTIIGTILLGAGVDTFLGSAADETVNGGLEEDTLSGGGGADHLIGEGGIDTLDGGEGADTLEGGLGDDNYIAGVGDTIIEAAGEGNNDSIVANSSFALAGDDDIESMFVNNLTSTTAVNLTGNAIGQSIEGNNGVNILSGLGGIDTLFGYRGNDRLIGGTGMDTQTGGHGNDRFVFRTAADSVTGVNRDVITDFTVAGTTERIDLSGFAGNFTFRGTGAFISAGKEVKFQAAGANTLVKIDLDGDTGAEMEILLLGQMTLTATDFLL